MPLTINDAGEIEQIGSPFDPSSDFVAQVREAMRFGDLTVREAAELIREEDASVRTPRERQRDRERRRNRRDPEAWRRDLGIVTEEDLGAFLTEFTEGARGPGALT
jgi:hypothetical protein